MLGSLDALLSSGPSRRGDWGLEGEAAGPRAAIARGLAHWRQHPLRRRGPAWLKVWTTWAARESGSGGFLLVVTPEWKRLDGRSRRFVLILAMRSTLQYNGFLAQLLNMCSLDESTQAVHTKGNF